LDHSKPLCGKIRSTNAELAGLHINLTTKAEVV